MASAVAFSSFGNALEQNHLPDNQDRRILPSTSIPRPDSNNRTFVIDAHSDLDNYKCRGRFLNITLDIDANIDLSVVTSATLVLPAWDVDLPHEVDYVYFNDRFMGSFIGSHNAWHMNTFALNLADIVRGTNRIDVKIDQNLQGWCVSVDWVAIEFDYASVFPEHSDRLIDDHSHLAGNSGLEVSVSFQNPSSTTCDIQGSLSDSDGTFIGAITRAGVAVDSVNNIGIVNFQFPAIQICNNGKHGPYNLNGVLFTCANNAQYMKATVHVTSPYGLNQFEGCTNRATQSPTPEPTQPPRVTQPPANYQGGGSKTRGPANPNGGKNPAPPGGVNGDPHFKTWSGAKYDYHGICDLVLLSHPGFDADLGMKINVRSKKTMRWSHISSAVVNIGVETFEVAGVKDGNTHWLNSNEVRNNDWEQETVKISGYPISYKRVHTESREYVIDLGNNESIQLRTWKDMIRVDIIDNQEQQEESVFGGSLGLMGSYPKGIMLGRDGKTEITELDKFGQEWQVLSSEQMIFHVVDGPQHPTKCEAPSKQVLRRRLAESKISRKDAEAACAHIRFTEDEFDLCVFDVMAIGDMNAAGAY